MDTFDENVQTLISMGFPNESEIRRALRLGKNDLSEAVAILTNENPTGGYDTLEELDVEMRDVGRGSTTSRSTGTSLPVYGPAPPPCYDEVVEASEQTLHTGEGEAGGDDGMGDSSLEFPVPNLYELENRVFTDSWSIPYKREESLGKCLLAATRLAEENLAESDQHCKRFLDRCMPECFQKLLTSGAVNRWGAEIQEGIYTMLQLLVDLVVAQLEYHPVPEAMLHVLARAFDAECEFHTKNKSRRPDKLAWDEKFGIGQTYAVSPSASSYKDPFGWLTNLINRFADKKGFDKIKERLIEEDVDAPSMAALLAPFRQCAEFLNGKVVQVALAPGMEAAFKFVENLSEDDLKDKRVNVVCDMLATMKLLCLHMWPSEVKLVDDSRLKVILRMLKSPHFNAKMNALKEVTKLIEESNGSRIAVKSAIDPDVITNWLVEEKVLSIALEGNIDQMQYCDKIKNVVDFLGSRLSVDELTKIWRMQNGQSNVVIDNIHSIVAAAGVKFNTQQLEHLVILIHQSWQVEKNKMREKLLSLIGKIGREARILKTTNRILDLLWDLSHLPALPTQLVEQALQEHLDILNDADVKDQVKRNYITKCINDIKEGTWVLPALKQLLQITKNMIQPSYKGDKSILSELNKSHELIKLVTNSLTKFHQMAAQQVRDGGTLSPETIVDGRYTHKDYMTGHLTFLQFTLQEGRIYLQWHRARDIWDTLIANPDAANWDREMCLEWFTKGISDLDSETQSQLFTKETLKLDSAKLTVKGFAMFKCFFEHVNQYENKLKRPGMTVEKLDLIGLDYLWEVCLKTPNEEIAEQSVNLLMTVCYTNLSPRLKRDPASLHKKFIDECYSRMKAATIPGSLLATVLSTTTTLVTAATVPEAANIPSPSRSANMLSIERLLLIAERYVVTVEESYRTVRSILPHGASFHGQPLHLSVTCESPKMDFNIQAHSNETVESVRRKIATRLKYNTDQIQVVTNDRMLSPGKDQKLLHQLDFSNNQLLTVRVFSSSVATTAAALSSTSTQIKEIQEGLGLDEETGASAKLSYDLEQEKMLPGVIMSQGGHVFTMLYRLADLDENKITSRARSLLELIPTDPSVQDAIDSVGQRHPRHPSPDNNSPKVSPRSSPRKYGGSPSVSPNSTLTRCKTPKDMLKALFDVAASEMSSFRVLYNLEVLSSKLMPTVRDPGTLKSARTFCDDFLDAGGLNLVVNILQKETIPAEVDYETRQGCYAIALQLLRFLLCGQEVTGEQTGLNQRLSMSASSTTSTPVKATSSSGGVGGGGDGPLHTAASRAIQTLCVSTFTEMVSCFMRVAWAAAAGKLNLASSMQPLKESNSLHGGAGSRSRQSSTGSTTSTGSEGESQYLHAGVCVKQKVVSQKDANIAKEALELLVTCLQLRSQLLATFYTQPCVSDFIIDILVGSTTGEVRRVALEQFYLLAKTEVSPGEALGNQPTPHNFILQTLLKARLPFWVSSSSTRLAGIRLLKQCSQYFDLRCRLIRYCTLEEQDKLQINVSSMLDDELAWLSNFTPSEVSEVRETDNVMLAAHLRLIKTLLTCEGVNKAEYGVPHLVQDLLHDFLFPASKLIMDDMTSMEGEDAITVNPKCYSKEARVAAYEVLSELADGCLANLSTICTDLIQMHHHPHIDMANQWEYMPPVDGRSIAGFVGLKNGGATCYMNSVLQQLYMTPSVVESVLSVDDEEVDEESVYNQMQNVFAHLLESKLQYYVPEKFWKVFKLWGEVVNVREQQDAFDFYQSVIDQTDEQLKKIGKEQIFKKKFQGVFSDQKICKGCPHRYEREEVFFALNVTVKNATLQDSLAQYVKGEMLEGDNAYFCEKCGEKRNTMKRMCIKTLPPVLCIQLKRFGYDWEAGRALKFDDHFKFPWVLDMEPYTAEGMTRQDAKREVHLENTEMDIPHTISEETGSATDDSSQSSMTINTAASNQINYELVGVVVHSGQANAGHYYSFIKDRRGTYITNTSRGKWYKFNDTEIEEFEMNDATLEAECFGGTYKAKVYEQSTTSYPEERLRFWNGYLLFYERIEERTPMSAKKTRISHPHRKSTGSGSEKLGGRKRDSLVELTELVHKGEKRGLFMDKMPARIQQVVRDENLRFMKNRGVYDVDYFKFVRDLVTKSSCPAKDDAYVETNLQAMKLAVEFLFNTYFRTKKKLRVDMADWAAAIELQVSQCKQACQWLVDYLSSERGQQYIKPFLLECPTKEIRQTFGRILEKTLINYFTHGGIATHKSFNELIEVLLMMLTKDVPDHVKNCEQYFGVLSTYVQQGTKSCSHMFFRKAYVRLIRFLLGADSVASAPATGTTSESTDTTSRRWSSIQSRDFGALHATLCTLVLNCEVSPYQTEDPGNFRIRKPTTVDPHVYLKMSPEMQKCVFGADSNRYVREVVLALREVSGTLSQIIDMLVYCSFCNEKFTMTLLKHIMTQYATAPSNELKNIFTLLSEVMLMEDPLQLKRLQCIIDGYADETEIHYEGMLTVIKLNHMNESRRSYQCIKFLVSLAHRCPLAKDYLIQTPTKWQWAVNWLKKKMTDNLWTPTVSAVASNEDSNSRSFQRTISAQDTLAEATALLTEFETHDLSDMDTNGDSSKEDDARQGSSFPYCPTDTLDDVDE